MSDPAQQLIEAGALSRGLIRAFGEDLPPCFPESMRSLAKDAARLAELHLQIMAAISVGYVEVSRQRNEALGAGTN